MPKGPFTTLSVVCAASVISWTCREYLAHWPESCRLAAEVTKFVVSPRSAVGASKGPSQDTADEVNNTKLAGESEPELQGDKRSGFIAALVSACIVADLVFFWWLVRVCCRRGHNRHVRLGRGAK